MHIHHQFTRIAFTLHLICFIGAQSAPSRMLYAPAKRSFVCPYQDCMMAFALSDDLKRHNRTHTGARPYKCTYPGCTMAFKRSSHLAPHNRTHTGERPYKCTHPGCGSAFAQSNNLTTHNRTHSKERPFACKYPGCGQSFKHSTHRREHDRTHTGERPYPCNYHGCRKTFRRSCDLARHKHQHPQTNDTNQMPIIDNDQDAVGNADYCVSALFNDDDDNDLAKQLGAAADADPFNLIPDYLKEEGE